jgi:transcriptional regulator with XRE-family HTH domain
MMTANEFRARLFELGYTQTAFAAHVGLALSTVNRWAKGKIEIPRLVEAYFEDLAQARNGR